MYKRRIRLFFSFILFFPAGLAGARDPILGQLKPPQCRQRRAPPIPSYYSTSGPRGAVPAHPSVRRRATGRSANLIITIIDCTIIIISIQYPLLDPAGCRRVGVGVSDIRPICRVRTVGETMRQKRTLSISRNFSHPFYIVVAKV